LKLKQSESTTISADLVNDNQINVVGAECLEPQEESLLLTSSITFTSGDIEPQDFPGPGVSIDKILDDNAPYPTDPSLFSSQPKISVLVRSVLQHAACLWGVVREKIYRTHLTQKLLNHTEFAKAERI